MDVIPSANLADLCDFEDPYGFVSLFDDEELKSEKEQPSTNAADENGFSPPPASEQQAPLHSPVSPSPPLEPDMSSTDNTSATAAPPPASVPSAGLNTNSDGLLVPPTNEPNHPFVNVFMIVDPKSMSCLIPKQVISYNSNNVVSTAVFGPTVLKPPVTPSDTVSSSNVSSALGTTEPLQASPEQSQEAQQLPQGNLMTSAMTPPATSPTLEPVVTTSMSLTPSNNIQSSRNNIIKTLAVDTTTSGDSSSNNKSEQLPPLRALSAYNFFFRDERERLLSGIEPDWSESKKLKLLQEHWFQDRNKKRRHRKSHGKIDFIKLSKLISTRWKELPEERKDFYRQIASRDFARFKQETAKQAATDRGALALTPEAAAAALLSSTSSTPSPAPSAQGILPPTLPSISRILQGHAAVVG